MIKRLSDRMLSRFVPRVEAAADDTFTQSCGCKFDFARHLYFRTCRWITYPKLYTCNPCYTDYLAC